MCKVVLVFLWRVKHRLMVQQVCRQQQNPETGRGEGQEASSKHNLGTGRGQDKQQTVSIIQGQTEIRAGYRQEV